MNDDTTQDLKQFFTDAMAVQRDGIVDELKPFIANTVVKQSYKMKNEIIDDLKPFITGTVSQQTETIRKEIVDELKMDINNLDLKLSSKIDDLSDAVADALENSNAEVDKQLRNHKVRITKLEGSAA